MQEPLRVLKIYSKQRRSVLASTSTLLYLPRFSSTFENGVGVRRLFRLLGPKWEKLAACFQAILIPIQRGGDKMVHWLVSHVSSKIVLLETKYGLRLTLNDGCIFEFTNTSHPHMGLNGRCAASVDEPLLLRPTVVVGNLPATYHYQLSPYWQSSILVQNNSGKHTLATEEGFGASVIEQRYPILAPLYHAWVDNYNFAVKQRGEHLFKGVDVFSDIYERVAWEIEGFLMACWLGLQDNVEAVEYCPYDMYRIENGAVELYRFLTHMHEFVSCPQ
ncbi:hypothetical protein BGW36DRAFT_403213 [Talaromyces proteolyticus]|uniref:Uncharacterized protein n=1 Tax=Talaromyces proteolyticus TaxID=1131652 RepID=A0AAD4Q1I5_9EURO|nr:uncharacterized protein BGW36DRAFT_403213 [Talaromyces proteolyticus]KAH8705685.1 hypothetical protein BGW36DRAFT_403213 [Talaromyces proteolyticus]